MSWTSMLEGTRETRCRMENKKKDEEKRRRDEIDVDFTLTHSLESIQAMNREKRVWD